MPHPITTLWTIWFCVACLYGICIGSFLNVVIYRLPLGQSVAEPVWSYCPNCKHRLSTLDLVPLVSFLALGRKCRYCRTPISWRYFGVELLTGVLFALVYLHDGPNTLCIFDALFVSLLVPIFFIDLEQFIIPNELCALGVALGLIRGGYAVWQGQPGQWMHVFGSPLIIMGSIGSAVLCALLFHMISFGGLLAYAAPGQRSVRLVGDFWRGVGDDYAYIGLKYLGFAAWIPAARRFIEACEREDPEAGSDEPIIDERNAAAAITKHDQEGEISEPSKTHAEIAAEIESDVHQTGMGQGDAKLAAMFGAYLLLPLSLVSFFLAVLSGTIVGVAIMARYGRGGRTAIPFGPFLVCGALLALLFGQQLIDWYVHFAFGMAVR